MVFLNFYTHIGTYKNTKTAIARLFNKMTKVYTKNLWFSKFFSFLKGVCAKNYCLADIDFKSDTKYYIIFFDIDLTAFSREYLQNLRSDNIRPVLMLGNAIANTIGKCTMSKLECFGDFIFSFDPADSEKYGFIYTQNIYSKVIENTETEIVGDIYYIGRAKNRMENLISVFEIIHENGVKSNYYIVGAKPNEMRYSDNINYGEKIQYIDSLKEMFKSNCILELVEEGQTGASLRYYEAVCYNKKLLTNNKNVVNLPFYNPKYIHVFEKPEDIDSDWVKERIPVDYGYDGRFSPVHLLDKIVELDKKREQESGKK